MDHNKSALERAFEIANAGGCRVVGDVRARLKAEGYDDREMVGPALRKQITAILRKTSSDEKGNDNSQAAIVKRKGRFNFRRVPPA